MGDDLFLLERGMHFKKALVLVLSKNLASFTRTIALFRFQFQFSNEAISRFQFKFYFLNFF
jgi:hypothetical protein